MPIYHLSVTQIGRAAGRSATAAAAYRSGTCIQDTRTGLVFDYTRKRGIDHTEILAPRNVPAWVHDRPQLWNAVELSEKRKDSQVAREIDVALPQELTFEQQLALIRGFARSQFVAAGMVADLAIHHANADNPHAHIMLTMRDIGPDGFGLKNTTWNERAVLQNWREAWSLQANKALEKAGHQARIDHRTLEAQGINRIPQIHIGPKASAMRKRGIPTDRADRAQAIASQNKVIADWQTQLEAFHYERDHAATASTQRRGDGERFGALVSGAREPSRSDERLYKDRGGRDPEHREHVPRAGKAMEFHPNSGSGGNGRGRFESGAADPSLAADSDQSSGSHRAGTREPVQPVGSHVPGGSDLKPRRWTRVDRILARGGISPSARAGAKPDAIDLAPFRQLDAMGATDFEISVHYLDGRTEQRSWTKAQVLENMPWLKRENAQDGNIFIGPAGKTRPGFVLVDDLSKSQLSHMQAAGVRPAIVIETSPAQFQAWVRVSSTPLEPALAAETAKLLAEQYGGNPASTNWPHLGRLAGLGNPAPQYRDASESSPYILLHQTSDQLAPAGQALLNQAQQRLKQRQVLKERQTRLEHAQSVTDWLDTLPRAHHPTLAYWKALKARVARYGEETDFAEADHAIGLSMAQEGFTSEQITQTLQKESPELPLSLANHDLDYVERTVSAVMAEWNALQLAKQRKEQQERLEMEQARQAEVRPEESDDGPSMR